MTEAEAQAFAGEWVAAWNSHDLDRILSHYATDIVLLTPLAQKLVGDGRIVGMLALRNYWGLALKSATNLKFELTQVFVGHDSLTVLYRNHREQQATETFEFDGTKVVRSIVCYA